MSELRFKGEFHARYYNPDGSLAWEETFPNGPTTEGLTDALSTVFNGGSQRSWRVGLIDATNFTELATADGMASHAGWQENTSYAESTRPAWSSLTVSGALAQNPVFVTFTFNATATIEGIFITSNSTKGGSTGILWATGLFSVPRSFVSGGILTLTYTVQAAGGT
jgi:hypothetical protein